MTTDELKVLHTLATVTRDSAHKAYTKALKMGRTDDNEEWNANTHDAYATLILTNQLRQTIYEAILRSIVHS